MMEFLSRPWQQQLADLLASSNDSLLVATPYIKRDAAEWLLEALGRPRRRQSIQTTVMTHLSAESVLNGSLDITALLLFTDTFRRVTVFDIHRLHAKVYIADEKRAIITSGNLTSSAFNTNYEYGVVVTEPDMAKKVSNDMQRYAKAGREMSRAELARLDAASRDFRGQYQRASRQLEAGARRELADEWNKIAARFGAPPGFHEIGSARFKGPIVELVTAHGPLTTTEICDRVQASWPYLCDDALMRVAKDGTRKRQWRHDLHTAQETLQRAGVLRRDTRGRWHVIGTAA